ncbi:MAG: tetratricopeptide repeat protein [Proteobacteria bacterium]|nr:tetratricopeptide repeat protein [Pseudomonadota bacterium]
MAWMPILLLGIAAMLTAILVLRLPKQGWMLFAAVLIFGLAGYGMFGSPGQPAAPKAAIEQEVRSGEQLVQARRSLFDDGSPPPSHLVTSDGYARQGRYGEAAGFLRNAIKDYPNDAETWLALAIALVEHAEGQVTPPAIAAFSKAQEAFPEHPGAGYFLGMAFLRSGRPEDARRVWAELLERSPEDAPWRQDLEFRLAGLDQLLAQMDSMRRMMEAQNAAEQRAQVVEE